MKSIKRVCFFGLLLLFSAFQIPKPGNNLNSLFFGASSMGVDLTDCSSSNSSDGISRAIAAINTRTTSRCIIQFGLVNPPSGRYTTTTDEDKIGPDKVFLAAAGSAFHGSFIAAEGQVVTLINEDKKYRVSFKEIILQEAFERYTIAKTLTGEFGCQ